MRFPTIFLQLILTTCLILAAAALHSAPQLVTSRFGRADLLWTCVVWMIPLAVWIVQQAFSARQLITTGLACALLAGAFEENAAQVLFGDNSAIAALSPFGASHLTCLLLTVCIACVIGCLPGFFSDKSVTAFSSSVAQSWQARMLTGGTLLLAAWVLPQAYAHLTARAQLQSLEAALQGDRWQLARQHVTVVLACDPQAIVLQQPLSTVVTLLDDRIQVLQKIIRQPLPVNAHPSDIGQHVTALMQLDQNQLALQAMRPLTTPPYSVPVVLDYCGLCCQRLEQWHDSQRWYKRSLKLWQQQPPGPERNAAVLSAWKGIAFALRRLDQPAAAEQIYLTALKNVPSAELHFLLAQFYEDQQQTSLAAEHARQAATLSPATYRRLAQELIDRMSHAHIGCLQTFEPRR